jgi:methionine-rich copper-binding protein CopC
MTIATTRSGTATATGDEPVRVRRLRAAVLAAAALTVAAGITLAGASPAFAHDELLGSSPEAGEVFDTAPTEIVLDFSNDIIEVGTAIEVVDHHGEEVAIGEPVIAGPQVTAALPADLEGDYQVRWRAVSSDGHPIEGTIDFGVGADATGVWEEQAPHDEATDGAAVDEHEGEQSAEATGADPWVIAGAVLGGLALIAVVAAVIVRSRRKAPGAE